MDNNPIQPETITTDQSTVEVPLVESENTPIEETTGEIVNMPDAPVTANSEPKVIEVIPEDVVAETPVEIPPTAPEEMYTARSSETGDKVYVIKAGKRYWVKNPETLAQLGFYLGKEKRIPFAELLGFPEGEPVDMTIPGAEYPWLKPEVEKSTEPTTSSAIWQ